MISRTSFVRSSVVLVTVGLASGCVLASAQPTNAPAAATTATAKTPTLNWVRDAGKAFVLQAVQPPPEAGSDKDKADLQAVLTAQGTRTDAQIAEAKADAEFKIDLLATVVGPDFTPEKYPVTYEFLKRVQAETETLNAMIQAKYPRRRTYQDHPEVKNLYQSDSPAYPSMQSADSRVLTTLLSRLFPQKTGALLTRDLEIAQTSVDAGVSYPSDIVGGRAMATSLVFVLEDNPLFQHDLTRAKAEIQKNSVPEQKKG